MLVSSQVKFLSREELYVSSRPRLFRAQHLTTPVFENASRISRQKLILIDPCITRGVRAAVGVPNVVLVCLTTAEQGLVAEQDAVASGFT